MNPHDHANAIRLVLHTSSRLRRNPQCGEWEWVLNDAAVTCITREANALARELADEKARVKRWERFFESERAYLDSDREWDIESLHAYTEAWDDLEKHGDFPEERQRKQKADPCPEGQRGRVCRCQCSRNGR